VWDILGHANFDVTQNVYGNSWWEERVDAVIQAVEAATNSCRYFRDRGKATLSVILASVARVNVLCGPQKLSLPVG
jgi:hypothetical protein